MKNSTGVIKVPKSSLTLYHAIFQAVGIPISLRHRPPTMTSLTSWPEKSIRSKVSERPSVASGGWCSILTGLHLNLLREGPSEMRQTSLRVTVRSRGAQAVGHILQELAARVDAVRSRSASSKYPP